MVLEQQVRNILTLFQTTLERDTETTIYLKCDATIEFVGDKKNII